MTSSSHNKMSDLPRIEPIIIDQSINQESWGPLKPNNKQQPIRQTVIIPSHWFDVIGQQAVKQTTYKVSGGFIIRHLSRFTPTILKTQLRVFKPPITVKSARRSNPGGEETALLSGVREEQSGVRGQDGDQRDHCTYQAGGLLREETQIHLKNEEPGPPCCAVVPCYREEPQMCS